MGLLSFIFGGNDDSDYDSESETLDPNLLYPLAEHWLGEASQGNDDDASKYRWDAVEYAEEESGGGFWHWLTGG